jgi:hypothetical protein
MKADDMNELTELQVADLEERLARRARLRAQLSEGTYIRPRNTKAPCPGCGARDKTRHADKVCDDCAHAIKNWSQHVAEVNANKELATVQLKSAHHWYPGFYFGGPNCHIENFDEARGELSRLFCELGELACVEKFDWNDEPRRKDDDPDIPYLFSKPVVRLPKVRGENYARPADYPSSEGSSCYHSLYGKIDRRLLEVIQSLWDYTARFAEMAYLGGVQDGRNLLLQLSSGQLSSEELQKKDMSLAKDVQNAKYLHSKLRRRSS